MSPGILGRLRNVVALLRGPRSKVAEIDAAEARRLQQTGAVVVDVRERFEFERGHVPGAINIPLTEVAERANEIPKDQPVVLHCALGSRSRLAGERLAGMGYENVKNLGGGFSEWKKAGLPVEEKDK